MNFKCLPCACWPPLGPMFVSVDCRLVSDAADQTLAAGKLLLLIISDEARKRQLKREIFPLAVLDIFC